MPGRASASKSFTPPASCARSGGRGDVPGATILWEAASEAEVRDALGSLPIFKAGMLEVAALVPLEPYPGFGPAK